MATGEMRSGEAMREKQGKKDGNVAMQATGENT
jgi:hypothetical protein